MGSVNQLIEVPDFAGRALLISSISPNGQNTDTVNASTARRVFAPGQDLEFAYQVIHPQPDGKPSSSN